MAEEEDRARSLQDKVVPLAAISTSIQMERLLKEDQKSENLERIENNPEPKREQQSNKSNKKNKSYSSIQAHGHSKLDTNY